jgi:hypothetical protein
LSIGICDANALSALSRRELDPDEMLAARGKQEQVSPRSGR